MKKFPFLQLSLLLCTLFIFSCGEPEEPVNPGVADDFVLAGIWDFQRVSGEGVILGVPQSDVDENPEGYVEFYDFGQGISSLKLTLLAQDLIKEDENINWEWISEDMIDIEEEDGAHEIWTLLEADGDIIRAQWDISIAGSTATILADLTRR